VAGSRLTLRGLNDDGRPMSFLYPSLPHQINSFDFNYNATPSNTRSLVVFTVTNVWSDLLSLVGSIYLLDVISKSPEMLTSTYPPTLSTPAITCGNLMDYEVGNMAIPKIAGSGGSPQPPTPLNGRAATPNESAYLLKYQWDVLRHNIRFYSRNYLFP
jgi:hypothetical protein